MIRRALSVFLSDFILEFFLPFRKVVFVDSVQFIVNLLLIPGSPVRSLFGKADLRASDIGQERTVQIADSFDLQELFPGRRDAEGHIAQRLLYFVTGKHKGKAYALEYAFQAFHACNGLL